MADVVTGNSGDGPPEVEGPLATDDEFAAPSEAAAVSEATAISASDEASKTARSARGATAWAGLAGLVAGGSALATGELLSGLSSRIPSLVVAVGEFIVDTTPGAIARWSIDQFGASQKTILVWGITIVSMLVAAAVGVAAWSRAQGRAAGAAIAALAFGAFGLLGGLAAARVPTASAGLAWLSAVVAAFVGISVLIALLRALRLRNATAEGAAAESAAAENARAEAAPVSTAPISTAATSAPQPATIQPRSRRGFLQLLGGTTIGAAAAALIGSRLRGRFAVEDAREQVQAQITAAQPTTASVAPDPTAVVEPVVEPAATAPGARNLVGVANIDDDVDGITPLIVPNDEFYRIDAALVVPQVDPANWSLRITGMVDNEIEFTFDDLLERASVEEAVTLSCVSNRVGGDLVGNAVWLGVPLRELLDEAGVQPGATQIVGRSVDNWTGGFPTAHLDDPDVVALVAVGMNGEPLPVIHGFPARLVIAGLYGYVSATKWVEEIHLTTLEDFNGYWITRGWSKLGPIKTQSRIDVPLPRDRRQLEPGIQPIAGVAWAPGRSVAQVEVRVDDGPWQIAELPDELSENAWRQWVLDWDATPGKHTIAVRATDGEGETQTPDITPPAPSGATGWHTIDVDVKGV